MTRNIQPTVDEDVRRDGQTDGPAEPGAPGRRRQPQAGDRRAAGEHVGDHQDTPRPPPDARPGASQDDQARQDRQQGDQAERAQPLAEHDLSGGERGRHQHVEAPAHPLLGQRGRRRHAQQEQADGDLERVDDRGDDRPALETTATTLKVAARTKKSETDGPRPARRAVAVPLPPEHGVGIERRARQPREARPATRPPEPPRGARPIPRADGPQPQHRQGRQDGRERRRSPPGTGDNRPSRPSPASR